MLEDKYAYLFLSLLYMIAWAIVYWNSPWKVGMIKVGVAGGLMGMIAEVWYFMDYWKPPTLFGIGVVGIEDYIIGFALFGVGGYIYSSFTNKEIDYSKKSKPANLEFFYLFLVACFSMTLFTFGFGIHSGYVTILTFWVLSIYIWIKRPDQIKLSLISAFATLGISLIIYYISFNILFPHFWDTYGMLNKPFFGYKILNIPISEMLWHFSWAMLCSMFHGFRNGVYYKSST
ncbi:lycopene cyclase domain-containing protein [Algoriphagus sp. SE2]|uniref:lycopene cyclase domain-containing protein n=1 Tax=Algoriphagus sp. SE2 TaxID=3141536 RepID=UPI0031CD9B9E